MSNAQSRPASVADFTFKVGDLTTEDLKVTGFTGTEGISALFEFRVELCSDHPDVDPTTIVAKPALLEISGSSGSRYVNGIVRSFERTGAGVGLTHYTAIVVPLHWLLTKRYKSRIFQEHNCPDMTVPGVITKVLTDAGVPADSYRLALQGEYAEHEYIVQYRESEMDFISRLMEQEGIFCFFEHGADGHKMALGDGAVAHTPTPKEHTFRFRDPRGMTTEQNAEYVFSLHDRQEIQFGAVALQDYNFQQPRLDLLAPAAGDQFTSLEHSDYPGQYTDRGVGDRYAQIRLEEFLSTRRVQELRAAVRALIPGYKFMLEEHPIEAFNHEYLVTRIAHTATQPQSAQEEAGGARGIEYLAEVQAIPSDVPFRPTRKTPKPIVQGSQTAIVVGPESEEIYTDKYGRVKVQFHWDREGAYDENSSRWIRVSQGAAGGQYGMMFLPRVGQEVVVDFLEGDPDCPLITGRVYNGDQMPPYALPDHKTRSVIKTNSSKGGGGTNEICFEDKKDGEQILIYAQKDWHVRVNNDCVENIDHDRHTTIKENDHELVRKSRSSDISLDLSQRIGGKKSLEVKGDVAEKFLSNHYQNVARDCYLKVDNELVIEAGKKLTIKAGGNFLVIDEKSLTMLATMMNLNSGGIAGVGAPVAAKATSAPLAARTAVPGKDVRYSATPDDNADGQAAGRKTEQIEEPEQQPSWIEIELVDEAGQPWPHERYEIVTPDGQVITGSLDKNGLAHVLLENAALCQVSFPNLDQEAWERV